MNEELLDGEISIYPVVKNLNHADVEEIVTRNAKKYDFTVTDEHMDVIQTLIQHYKEECEQKDCHSAFRHMQFLKSAYEQKGGSKYLYSLFDQGSESGEGGSEVGIITRIHELVELPELTNNTDDGLGIVL